MVTSAEPYFNNFCNKDYIHLFVQSFVRQFIHSFTVFFLSSWEAATTGRSKPSKKKIYFARALLKISLRDLLDSYPLTPFGAQVHGSCMPSPSVLGQLLFRLSSVACLAASLSTVLSSCFQDDPGFSFPVGFTCLVTLLVGFLRMCQIQPHLRLL